MEGIKEMEGIMEMEGMICRFSPMEAVKAVDEKGACPHDLRKG